MNYLRDYSDYTELTFSQSGGNPYLVRVEITREDVLVGTHYFSRADLVSISEMAQPEGAKS